MSSLPRGRKDVPRGRKEDKNLHYSFSQLPRPGTSARAFDGRSPTLFRSLCPAGDLLPIEKAPWSHEGLRRAELNVLPLLLRWFSRSPASDRQRPPSSTRAPGPVLARNG